MARLITTIWALMLNTLGLPIFQICFANAMEDEDGESLLSGPPITLFFFNLGVYIIIVNSTLFPRSFREPKPIFLALYEFLVTAFLLEFTSACIWAPVDVLILTTLPKSICKILSRLGFEDTAEAFLTNKSSMAIITLTISITFLLVTLHVTDSVDFTVFRNYGAVTFASYVRNKLWERIKREFPSKNGENKSACRCKTRRRGRSKSRANNNT